MIVALTTGMLVLHLRAVALNDAEKEFGRLSLILTEQAERAFEAVDLVQTGMLERLKDNGVQTPEDFRQAMYGGTIY